MYSFSKPEKRYTYLDAYPKNVFKVKKRHHDDSVFIDLEPYEEESVDLAKRFYSEEDSEVKDVQQKKNYFETHPFYSLFFNNDEESEEVKSIEEEEVIHYEEDKEIKNFFKRVGSEVVEMNRNANIFLDEWEQGIKWDLSNSIQTTSDHMLKPFVNKSVWKISDKAEEPIIDTHQKADGKWSIFPLENDLLQTDKWWDNIYWTEEDIEHRKKVPLYLDLNDYGLLLKEAVIPLQQEKKEQEKEEQKKENDKKEEKKPLLTPFKEKMPSLLGGNNDIVEHPLEEPQDLKQEGEEEEEEKKENDKKEKEIKFWRIEDERIEEGISNDRYYFMGKTGYTQKKFIIYHSIPAIRLETFQTHLTMPDLQHFHRPVLGPRDTKNMVIVGNSLEDQNNKYKVNNTYIPQNMKELSSKDGKISLIEYIEEFPPLLSQIGMGARIRNYCQREDEALAQQFKTGEEVIVESGEESPFLGEVESEKPIQSLDNKMTKTPIHETNIPMTDFLLIRSEDGDSWTVREIDHLFVAGQQQPQKDTEVFIPGSKKDISYNKERLETAIHLQFHKTPTVKVQDFVAAFPKQTETTVRKILRKCSTFIRKGNDNGGSWELKKDFELQSEEDLFTKVTPERVCYFETMMAGIMRLQDKRITLYKYSQLITAEQQFSDELKKRVEPIVEEVRKAPWTSMDILSKAIKGGCPTDYQVKESQDPRHLIEFHRKYIPKQFGTAKLQSEIKEKYGDLRKLSIKQLKNALQNVNVTDESDLNKSRWELVNLLQSIVAKSIGVHTEVGNSRPTTSTQQMTKKQKKKIKRIFSEQIDFITDDTIIDNDEIEDQDQAYNHNRLLYDKYISELNNSYSEQKQHKQENLFERRPVKTKHFSEYNNHRIDKPEDEIDKVEKRKQDRKIRERNRRIKKKEEVKRKEEEKKERLLSQLGEDPQLLSLAKLDEEKKERKQKKDLKKSVVREESKIEYEDNGLRRLLDSCLNVLKKNPLFSAFTLPVESSIIDYQSIVRQSIDLQTMTRKVRKGTYKTIDEFIKDIELLVDNCYRYNTRGAFGCPLLIVHSELLYEITLSYISEHRKQYNL